MKWVEGEIEGLVVEKATKYKDERGWVSEIFRADEVDDAVMPVMSYISVTHAGVTRGPHEHRDQTDRFAFLGPGDFRVKFWDDRTDSPTYGRMQAMIVGESNPVFIIVPPCVVHGYTNISDKDTWVVNCPNRLYAGEGKKQPVDEVRYEDDEASGFSMKD